MLPFKMKKLSILRRFSNFLHCEHNIYTVVGTNSDWLSDSPISSIFIFLKSFLTDMIYWQSIRLENVTKTMNVWGTLKFVANFLKNY